MLKRTLVFLFFTFITSVGCTGKSEIKSNSLDSVVPATDAGEISKDKNQHVQSCIDLLNQMPGPYNKMEIESVCRETQLTEGCMSVNGTPIFHYDKAGVDKRGKKILALSLIHGDETPSGSVARAWMARLQNIEPRNSWRVIPVVNPDGFKQKTRYNANQVDINRNFPSQDWSEKALEHWEKTTNKDKRRYPGPQASSEPETRCLVTHLEAFKPDFIISVHTPLGVLDFDGPRISNPGFKPLPWVALGNFSGSLGRYMWVDNKIPVLTIELKGNQGMQKLEQFDHLQDISGTVAIQALKALDQNSVKK